MMIKKIPVLALASLSLLSGITVTAQSLNKENLKIGFEVGTSKISEEVIINITYTLTNQE